MSTQIKIDLIIRLVIIRYINLIIRSYLIIRYI